MRVIDVEAVHDAHVGLPARRAAAHRVAKLLRVPALFSSAATGIAGSMLGFFGALAVVDWKPLAAVAAIVSMGIGIAVPHLLVEALERRITRGAINKARVLPRLTASSEGGAPVATPGVDKEG